MTGSPGPAAGLLELLRESFGTYVPSYPCLGDSGDDFDHDQRREHQRGDAELHIDPKALPRPHREGLALFGEALGCPEDGVAVGFGWGVEDGLGDVLSGVGDALRHLPVFVFLVGHLGTPIVGVPRSVVAGGLLRR